MPRKSATVLEASHNTVPIASALSEFLAFHKQKGSSPLYVQQLDYFLGDRKKQQGAKWSPLLAWAKDNKASNLGDLTKTAITQWLSYLRAQTSEDTHFKATESIRRLLRFCVDEGYLREMPLRIVRPKVERKEICAFTKEEVERLAAVVREENPRDWAIFMLLLDTGMRVSELVGVKVDDLHWGREEVLVRGKGHKQRTLSIHGSLGALSKYRRIRPQTAECDAFFLAYPPGRSPSWGNGRKSRGSREKYSFAAAALTRRGLHDLISKWGRLAGLTEARCSPHTFRHYYAVQFMRNGGRIDELQKLLGHAKLETVMIYAKLADVDVKKAARNYSPALDILPARFRTAIEV